MIIFLVRKYSIIHSISYFTRLFHLQCLSSTTILLSCSEYFPCFLSSCVLSTISFDMVPLNISTCWNSFFFQYICGVLFYYFLLQSLFRPEPWILSYYLFAFNEFLPFHALLLQYPLHILPDTILSSKFLIEITPVIFTSSPTVCLRFEYFSYENVFQKYFHLNCFYPDYFISLIISPPSVTYIDFYQQCSIYPTLHFTRIFFFFEFIYFILFFFHYPLPPSASFLSSNSFFLF